MSSPQSWRSSMSFSDRLDMIVKMQVTTQLKQANRDVIQSEAKARAKTLEKEAYQIATSREAYGELCNISSQPIDNASSGPSTQNAALSDDASVLPHSDLHIGKYTNAMHHRSGLFSTIYKALDSTDPPTLVALKLTNPSSTQPPHDSHREARLLRLAASPHVVPLLETFLQPGGLLVLSFPFIRYDLQMLMHPTPASTSSPSSAARLPILTIPQRKSLLHNLFRALTHLHSLAILHRDIKPSNILLRSPSGPAYLADFGIAYHHPRDTLPNAPVHSPHAEGETMAPEEGEDPARKITDIATGCYRAPELLFGCGWYGAGVDLWAAGCVVAEVATWGGQEVSASTRGTGWLLDSRPRHDDESDASAARPESTTRGDDDDDATEAAAVAAQHWRAHGTLFDSGPVGSDLALLGSVFRRLGTPTAATWPEARAFPDWGKMAFYEFPAVGWEALLPGVEAEARDLVARLVRYESGERLSAEEALGHLWLAEGPEGDEGVGSEKRGVQGRRAGEFG
ncbi:MAG: hypothetical protein M1821_004379 [Bathelium mastoideum]|nr:MAG: hypothetical protein M1821_004379 [Bathelium mastoideum]